ncbi:MAG: PAS domain S-box protein [Planctomycetes bacterium]|nr:PAS domain S-box protein [Planctomycetota bacterium]
MIPTRNHLLCSMLFEQSDLPMVLLDTSGHILDWNTAAERTLGFTRDEASGQSALLVRRRSEQRKLDLLLKRIVQEQKTAAFETTVTRRDGTTIPVELDFAPLVDASGHVAAVGVVLRDLTRRRELERRLAEQEKMVTLGRLAGGLSHHINNILAAVSAQVELALVTQSPDAAAQALRLTSHSVDRLTHLTRNLLLFTAADHRPAAARCRPGAALRTLADHLRGELAERGIALETVLAETPEVALATQDMQQLVHNLILNACEAMGDRGTIEVRLVARGSDVVLTVSDTGRGIADYHVPHVFEPFWTTRGSIAGGLGSALGLGLTVSQSLTVAAGGTLRVASTGPDGTTLRLQLPGLAPQAVAGDAGGD